MIHTVIDIDNIQLFAKGLDLLGDLSVSARDFKNALHYYNKMVFKCQTILIEIISRIYEQSRFKNKSIASDVRSVQIIEEI